MPDFITRRMRYGGAGLSPLRCAATNAAAADSALVHKRSSQTRTARITTPVEVPPACLLGRAELWLVEELTVPQALELTGSHRTLSTMLRTALDATAMTIGSAHSSTARLRMCNRALKAHELQRYSARERLPQGPVTLVRLTMQRLTQSQWTPLVECLIAGLFMLNGVAVAAPTAPAMLSALSGDPSGPMTVQIPPNLCGIIIPPWTGLPPAHPLANLNDPTTQQQVNIYADQENLRGFQMRFCAPLLDQTLADQATVALPASCRQPADPIALIDPIHPLADTNRSDVVAAKRRQLDALQSVEQQRARCKQLATGVVTPASAPVAPLAPGP